MAIVTSERTASVNEWYLDTAHERTNDGQGAVYAGEARAMANHCRSRHALDDRTDRLNMDATDADDRDVTNTDNGTTADSDGPPTYHPVWENRVRFAETDQQRIVFYGEYFTYQDETVSAFLREIAYDYDAIREDGWEIHVVNSSLDYRNPARFEDVLVNEMRVARIGTASIEFDYRTKRKADGKVLVEGSVTHVAVDPETGESTRVPDEFRAAVESFQGGFESALADENSDGVDGDQ